MQEKEYIYVIYVGCFHEGLHASEFYKDRDRAIKMGLMKLEEKKKEFEGLHYRDSLLDNDLEEYKRRWEFVEKFEYYDYPGNNVILCFQNCIEEVSVVRHELL